MNTVQAQTIEAIKTLMLASESLSGRVEVEIKKLEIDENEYFVSLYVSVGRIGDEGTMLQLLGRDGRHFFIGKRGGVTLKGVDHNGKYSSVTIKGLRKAINYLPV
jgi:hypothetical protein